MAPRPVVRDRVRFRAGGGSVRRAGPGAIAVLCLAGWTAGLAASYERAKPAVEDLAAVRDEGINIEEVENTVFDGAKAASCAILLDQEPSAKLLDSLRANPSILHVMLNRR